MITDYIYAQSMSVVAWMLGAFPAWSPDPGGLQAITEWTSTAGLYSRQLDGWIPFSTLGQVAAFVLGSFGTAVAIKVARISASHATGGGGSAA